MEMSVTNATRQVDSTLTMKVTVQALRKALKKASDRVVTQCSPKLSEIRTFHGKRVTESDGGTERR
jgi:hypothetical protein